MFIYRHCCVSTGTDFVKNLWGEQTSLFAFRWRHHVHPTVVRPFCKSGQIGGHYGIETWIRPSWWYSNYSVYKYTMVLCLALSTAFNMKAHQFWELKHRWINLKLKSWLYENSQNALRAANDILEGHMRPACLRPWTGA